MFKYLRDPKVSLVRKLIVIGMLIYIFSPIDLLPDPVLGLGLIDDTVLVIYVISMISDELDKYILKEKHDLNEVNRNKTIENVDYEIKDD